MYDRLDAIDVEGVVRYVSSLQQEDGSFFGKNLILMTLGYFSLQHTSTNTSAK